MAVETQIPLTAYEIADAKDAHEPDDLLKEFGKSAVALRKVLYQDRSLTTPEFLFMEQHFQILEMAYFRWKRKHGESGGSEAPI